MMLGRSSTVITMASLLVLVAGCRKHERTLEAPRPDASHAPARAAPQMSSSGSAGGRAFAAPVPSASAPERLPTALAGLQRILSETPAFEPVTSGDRPDLAVSPATQRVLRTLKDLLLFTVDRSLPLMLERPLAANALEKMLVSEGAIWATDDWKDGAIDGSIVAAPKHRERWLVTLCILVAPGSDCLAAVYERRGGATRRAMVFRHDDYSSVEGAVHALSWVISPPNADDRFYLLEAHTYPWMSSSWRTFSYSVLEAGTNAESPRRVAGDSDYASWMDGFDLNARADGFTVAFSTADDDVAKFTKKAVHRWKKTATGFERLRATASPKASAK